MANLMTGSAINILADFRVIRILSALRPNKSERWDGVWKQSWSVTSPRFPISSESAIRFFSWWNLLAGEFTCRTLDGRSFDIN